MGRSLENVRQVVETIFSFHFRLKILSGHKTPEMINVSSPCLASNSFLVCLFHFVLFQIYLFATETMSVYCRHLRAGWARRRRESGSSIVHTRKQFRDFRFSLAWEEDASMLCHRSSSSNVPARHNQHKFQFVASRIICSLEQALILSFLMLR